jgi:CHAT domain-containing protein
LGDILRIVGDLKKSENILGESLKIAQSLNADAAVVAAQLSLGNTAFAQFKRAQSVNDETKAKVESQKAVNFYRSVIEQAASEQIKLRSQLNLLSLLVETNQQSDAEKIWPEIENSVRKLSPSLLAIASKINLSRTLLKLNPRNEAILSLLTSAMQQAKALRAQRLESYAVGYLGQLYELNQQDAGAIKLTETALKLAQSNQYFDSAYQWQWQLGRLYNKTGNRERAIASYTAAVKTLESLRTNLVAINPEGQFSFRDQVEPIYRQLVDLLLQSQPSQENLQAAIEQIDALQLAEIENFLRCKVAAVTVNQAIDKQAAIVYPIVLDKRLAVIFQLAGQPLQYHETLVSQQTVEKTLKDLRGYLSGSNSKTPDVIQEAQKVYEWIVKPFEPILAQSNSIKTLVFVLDGTLRNIPMSVLYDSEREEYLIEKDYAIAVAPRLELFAPKPLAQRLKVFVGGVGEPQVINNHPFEQIEYLEEELAGIGQITTINKPLLNAGFTKINIQNQIEQGNFSAIHIKTHGVFSSDPDNTFIVAYQDILKGEDLANLVKTGSDIELLVLSACQTAEGDNRAVLGLAGIAVRAGARSTLSTLWIAQDRATTELMLTFYEELSKPGMSRANALHIAQKALFERYPNPYIWATYVLVGNWL